MHKGRLEAFSDGVFAILITIMVLELKVPHGSDLAALLPMIPVFISYVLSFIFLAIYWNNHHHLLQASQKINGAVLWANAHLLFWLSLIPFVTAWMGENEFSTWPVAIYGLDLLLCAVAYTVLVKALLSCNTKDSVLARAIGHDFKGWVSLAIYVCGLGLAFVNPYVSGLLYFSVSVIWLIPDRRIEKTMAA